MSHLQFPRLYSGYVAHFTEDLPLWRSLASAASGPILELGCGPGRILADLSSRGYTVTGLDNDPEMLEWACSTLPNHLKDHIDLVEADMRSFNLEQHFPLILVPCNTFAYFSDQEAQSILLCIRKHLTREGQGVLVVPNPDQSTILTTTGGEIEDLQDNPVLNYIEPLSGNPVQVFAVEKPDWKKRVIDVTWAFDELFPEGKVQRTIKEISYHIRSMEDTLSLMMNMGLRCKGMYGDYQYGPIRTTSGEIIFFLEHDMDR